MKTKFIAAAVLAAFAATAAQAEVQSFKVNGQLVTKAQQEKIIKNMTSRGQIRTPQLESQVRNRLTSEIVLQQEAEKLKLNRRQDVKEAIDAARNAILTNAAVNEYIKKHPVSDADVQKLYNQEKTRWGSQEVSVRHILVKDEATARRLLDEIKKGGDFAKLARENTLDTQANKNAGGLIEWTSPRIFEPSFAEGFKNLKKGELAATPIKTSLGWHIMKLEDTRAATRYSNYKDWEPVLRRALVQQRVQSHIDELVRKAKIQNNVK
ncbi:MAG TPA: peptidylprolyl isomerase [Sutterella sp.]|nr:peptidylprolyl isomerase [Sutterella sp.]